mmetsp:Transcript_16950/g.34265  ORF Transcript_16950/g.34265 Transcript_16950/m.34265 type:complete len:634 (-) Transcript_16950:2221-4122(-)
MFWGAANEPDGAMANVSVVIAGDDDGAVIATGDGVSEQPSVHGVHMASGGDGGQQRAEDAISGAAQQAADRSDKPVVEEAPIGRVDEALFSDALQAADDLQELGFFDHGEEVQRATDRVDAMLLQTIETELDGQRVPLERSNRSESSSHDEHLVSNDVGDPPVGTAALETLSDAASTGHRRTPTGNRRAPTDNRWQAGLLIQRMAVSTLTLLYHEALRLLALAPLIIWIALGASDSVESSNLDTGYLFLWLLFFWLIARTFAMVASPLAASFFMRSRAHLPLVVFLILQSFEGWPFAVTLCGLLLVVGTEIHVWNCAEVVSTIHAMNSWWAVYSWWMVLGLGFGVMLGFVRFYISMTTSRHYTQRANELYQAQKVLRKIFHAARSKQHQHRRIARSQDKRRSSAPLDSSQITSGAEVSKGSPTEPRHVLGWRFCKKNFLAASHASRSAAEALPMIDDPSAASLSKNGPTPLPPLSRSATSRSLADSTVPDLSPGLAQQLESLNGPLHLSGDSNASTLSSARFKAGKCFDLLVQHNELLAGQEDAVDSKQQPALVRERLLRWAGTSHLDGIGPNSLFGTDKVFDKEMFVSSVERCYKEQRLLTASVTTFDQINTSLIHFCMIIWCAASSVSSLS